MTGDLRLALKSDAFREFCSANSNLLSEFNTSGLKDVTKFIEVRETTIRNLVYRLKSEGFANEHIKLCALRLTVENGIRIPQESVAYPELL
ncbi:hypothetical protein EBB79_03940 [Parasedimentitalea marina]|uniref:Uncharacterized protein n=2 Tax=Parasedimentitalea marina TaxID=2483033 RepID=A0A3T0MZD7_9RHOB|nr:hypothetical protein EBB79_03940 [Parasedimentitalea marina]